MAALEEIRILQILQKHSDEEHRLQQKEILRLFEDTYNEKMGIKRLRRILRDLAAGDDSVDCEESSRMRDAQDTESAQTLLTDFYVSHLFSDEELRLLIDAVTFMPHLPASFGKEMTEKLKSLASRHFQPRHVLASERSVRYNHDLLLSVGEIDKAIRMDRKVHLKYLQYELNGSRSVRRNSAGKERVHTISPYQFAMSGGSYYIICNNDRFNDLAHYRVDRLKDVEILDVPRRPLADVCPGSRDLDGKMLAYCQQHAYMFHGDPIYAELGAQRSAVQHLIDTFGDNVTLREQEGSVLARVRAVPDSIMQFAKAHATAVTILSPESLRSEAKAALQEALSRYD